MKYGKNRIKVFVRILPTDAPYPSNVEIIDNEVIKVKREGLRSLKLTTDGIFSNASQEDTYQIVTRTDLVKKLLEGVNASILAYGINTAGKSFTIFGGLNYNQRGLLPRTLIDIYKEVRLLPRSCSATIKISAFDLTGDAVNDLLSPSVPDFKECKNMKDIAVHVAANEEEAICLFLLAMTNKKALKKKRKLRTTADWGHVIFNVNLEIESGGYSSDKRVSADLKFVELAGAVGVLLDPVTKEQLIARESISLLEHSITNPRRCPSIDNTYCVRCKLTHLLKDDVCGRTNIVLVLHVRLETDYMKSTIQTLMFAQRLLQMRINPQTLTQSEMERSSEKLAEDVRALKAELYRRDLVCNRKPLNYSTPSQNQKEEIYRRVRDFLEEKNATVEVQTLTEMQTALESIRAIYKNAEMKRSYKSQLETISDDSVEELSSEASSAEGEGSLDGKGFGVGLATPEKIAANLATDERPKSVVGTLSGDTFVTQERSDPDIETNIIDESAVQRWTAFEDFKRRAGRHANENFLQHKALTEKKKTEFNRVLERLREIKRELRTATEWYRELCLRATDLMVMEEIAELLERVEALTTEHDTCAAECIKALGEVRASQRIGHRQRQQFLRAFDSWYEKKLAVVRYQQIIGSQEFEDTEIIRPKAKTIRGIPCHGQSSRVDEEIVFQRALEHVNKWVKHARISRKSPTKGRSGTHAPTTTFDFLHASKTI